MTLEARSADRVGVFRHPHNPSQSAKGSIHDDATASRFGFKGDEGASGVAAFQTDATVAAVTADNVVALFAKGAAAGDVNVNIATAGSARATLRQEQLQVVINAANSLIPGPTLPTWNGPGDLEEKLRLCVGVMGGLTESEVEDAINAYNIHIAHPNGPKGGGIKAP